MRRKVSPRFARFRFIFGEDREKRNEIVFVFLLICLHLFILLSIIVITLQYIIYYYSLEFISEKMETRFFLSLKWSRNELKSPNDFSFSVYRCSAHSRSFDI